MARLPRLHRVVGIWPDGRKRTRNYLTPEAAAERRETWEARGATVTVTPSYPVAFPSVEADRLDIPDMILARSAWHDLVARLGINPAAVHSITVTPSQVVVEYDPDPKRPGKREPKLWLIETEEN